MFFVVGSLATLAIMGIVSGLGLLWRILLALIAIGALILLAMSGAVSTRGSADWWQQPLWRNLILYAAMFLGMMFRVVQDQLETWRQKNAQAGVRRRRRPQFDVWEFVFPVIPSLALFQAVLGSAGQNELSLSLTLASFQNGFFWHALLARTHQRLESSGSKA